ncbi:Basic proline-rich protein precursor [Streptomyces venezuelae]|nr:Basic proline-rich protein precursor [Streptomyces venezuelae]
MAHHPPDHRPQTLTNGGNDAPAPPPPGHRWRSHTVPGSRRQHPRHARPPHRPAHRPRLPRPGAHLARPRPRPHAHRTSHGRTRRPRVVHELAQRRHHHCRTAPRTAGVPTPRPSPPQDHHQPPQRLPVEARPRRSVARRGRQSPGSTTTSRTSITPGPPNGPPTATPRCSSSPTRTAAFKDPMWQRFRTGQQDCSAPRQTHSAASSRTNERRAGRHCNAGLSTVIAGTPDRTGTPRGPVPYFFARMRDRPRQPPHGR